MKQRFLHLLSVVGRALVFLLINAIVILVVIGALSAAFMYLWDYTMPALFGLPTITLCQAFGLILLLNVALITITMPRYSDKD